MNTQTDVPVAEWAKPKNLFLVIVPIFDRLEEYLSIWQFTTRAEDAKSLIDRLSHLLHEKERWFILRRFCPDNGISMGDCTILDEAGYVIGEFAVVKLGAELPPRSYASGLLKEIDLSAESNRASQFQRAARVNRKVCTASR